MTELSPSFPISTVGGLKPAAAAAANHCNLPHGGPARQLGIGRLITGQPRDASQESRSAETSVAT
jgi:hypothetical protein